MLPQPGNCVSLASLKQLNHSIRAMAKLLGRPASTIRRELQRNSTADQYASGTARIGGLQHKVVDGNQHGHMQPDADLGESVRGDRAVQAVSAQKRAETGVGHRLLRLGTLP